MSTTRETVHNLCQSIMTRLENKGAIEFDVSRRKEVYDAVNALLSPYIVSDQDIRERALETLGEHRDALSDFEFVESERFRTAKRLVRKQLGDDELHGLFFQETVKNIAARLREFLLSDALIDEVFEDDQVLDQLIVDAIKEFRP